MDFKFHWYPKYYNLIHWLTKTCNLRVGWFSLSSLEMYTSIYRPLSYPLRCLTATGLPELSVETMEILEALPSWMETTHVFGDVSARSWNKNQTLIHNILWAAVRQTDSKMYGLKYIQKCEGFWVTNLSRLCL